MTRRSARRSNGAEFVRIRLLVPALAIKTQLGLRYFVHGAQFRCYKANMHWIARILTALNALIHGYIAWFEMTAWESRGPRAFPDLPAVLFEQGAAMAANQGLYNGFLAAGLIWALFIKDARWQRNVATCFLIFVAAAGIFGALTVATTTLFVQTLPASLALLAVWALRRKV